MWEDVLTIMDDETGNDEGRLFVQDDNWDGGQYLRYRFLSLSLFLGCPLHFPAFSSVLFLATIWQNTAELQPLQPQPVTVSPEHRVLRLACVFASLLSCCLGLHTCPFIFVHS